MVTLIYAVATLEITQRKMTTMELLTHPLFLKAETDLKALGVTPTFENVREYMMNECQKLEALIKS